VLFAIRDMHVRGAGLIGATAAYGMYLAALTARCQNFQGRKLKEAGKLLSETRPTAVNLQWAIDRQLAQLEVALNHEDYVALAFKTGK
jgi:methylthioribose-1-phosphate isomerase